jgi:prophage antirepressor-like protein
MLAMPPPGSMMTKRVASGTRTQPRGTATPILVIINEAARYRFVLRSNKPEAKRFQKWVVADVLPAQAIYEELHPETKHGEPGASHQIGDTSGRSENDRFTEATSEATGKSERNIQRTASHRRRPYGSD